MWFGVGYNVEHNPTPNHIVTNLSGKQLAILKYEEKP
jgi:hypothetical protein